MKENARISIERNLREQKIKEALSKKPTAPFLNKHGMTPTQIHQAFSRQHRKHPVTGKIVSVPKTLQNPPKPLKVIKAEPSAENAVLSIQGLNADSFQDLAPSIEYTVPDWFLTTEKADISVIIPLYKSNQVVVDLINSWTFEHQGLKIEAIFVDDHCPYSSKDAVLQTWEKRGRHKVGKIIYNTANKGYGASCNVGAEYASGDYLIFLNADTRLTPNWIEPMIRLMKADSQVGLVGNLQLKEGGTWDGTIDSAGSEWDWSSMTFLHIGRHSYKGNHLPFPLNPKNAPPDILQIAEREMVTGCCFAVPTKLWKYIGGFNPNYRVGYWEDADICLTVRETNHKIMFQPESVIYHKLSHTNSGAHPYHDANRNYFMNKWVNSQRIDGFIANRRNGLPSVNTILLKRTGANGDVLLASGVAAALKERYRDVKIAFATGCGEVLENNPYIDQIVPAQFQPNSGIVYNLDLVYERRPYTNILTSYAEEVGVNPKDCKLFLATQEIPQTLPDNFVVIHPGKTCWVGRDWTHENFKVLADLLINDGIKLVCVGRESEESLSCTLDLRGQLSIAQLAFVINKADLFVGIDSFPMHVAQTFDKKGVCFFGSIEPSTRLISGNIKPVVAEGLSCLGCHHRKSGPRVVTNVCETGTLDCIQRVQVNTMYNTIRSML